MRTPSALKTGRACMVEIGSCAMCVTIETPRATRLTGVTPVKEASAVVVVRIHPQPVPDSRATASMVARAISPATAVWAMRRRAGAPGPAQTQPRNRTPSAAGKRAQDHARDRAEAFRHGEAGHQEADHERVVVCPRHEREQDQG